MVQCSSDIYCLFKTIASSDKVCRQIVGSLLFTHFVMNTYSWDCSLVAVFMRMEAGLGEGITAEIYAGVL